MHEDLLPLRIQRDQSDVQTVQDTITLLFVHPFSKLQLVILSSGIVATEKMIVICWGQRQKGKNRRKASLENALLIKL